MTTPYSQLHKEPRVPLAEKIPLPHPLVINIEPTNVCNFKCTFCPESFPDYKKISGGHHHLSPDDFAVIATQIKDLGKLETLKFFMMGEPMANKHLWKFIRQAKDMELAWRTIVSSNGTLLRPSMFQDISDSRLDYLRISIYGGNEEAQKKRTQSRIKLKDIAYNVGRLKDFLRCSYTNRPFIYAKMVTASPEEDAEFLKMFKPIVDEACIEPLHNWHSEDENLSGKATDELLTGEYFRNKKEVCPFPFYTLVIHSDLKVSVCCVDWDKKTVVGDLHNETLKEVWEGEALRRFRRLHLERRRNEIEACRNCTFIHAAVDNIDSLTSSDILTETARAADGLRS